jgi:hypothetical protein
MSQTAYLAGGQEVQSLPKLYGALCGLRGVVRLAQTTLVFTKHGEETSMRNRNKFQLVKSTQH